jgi:pyruvate kinase
VHTTIKKIVTLGPATFSDPTLLQIKERGVDYVRVNMSHSSFEDMVAFSKKAKSLNLPFMLDTEGSQFRVGDLESLVLELNTGDKIKIFQKEIRGNKSQICLTPKELIPNLEEGDLIHVDFDTCILQVFDTTPFKDAGYIWAQVFSPGFIGRKKAVIIDSVFPKKFKLPTLSEKDLASITFGLKENIGAIAVSYVRSGRSVQEVRQITQDKMFILSKIECPEALDDLDSIIKFSDGLLLDRGDLSKEIPIERIPMTQKIVIEKARGQNKPVFIATNLLETMVSQRKPTRAEVCDIENALLDGARGLVLSAETAIGQNPIECINMLNRLITHVDKNRHLLNKPLVTIDEKYLTKYLDPSSSLIAPHGHELVNQWNPEIKIENLKDNPRIQLNINQSMDLEQIAMGTFSPLKGFLNEKDFWEVVSKGKLTNGVTWPIPVQLDVDEQTAKKISLGSDCILVNDQGVECAKIKVESIFTVDKNKVCSDVFKTNDMSHPGVKQVHDWKNYLIGGTIELFQKRKSFLNNYLFSPRQMRRLFDEKGWTKIVGFHTRNVPHRSHEQIQLNAIDQYGLDGIFVHPVTGVKKKGDFTSEVIIKAYEELTKKFYPKNKSVIGCFNTYSRYAGPREALFTAICRKNYGCSHFIVGRDHTGVGNFYTPYESQEIFDQFPELNMTIIKTQEIKYSPDDKSYTTSDASKTHESISGTLIRSKLLKNEMPPEWMMRPEIAQIILNEIKLGREIFIP